MKFKEGDPVIVKATGMLGVVMKIRPTQLQEYTVRILDNNTWYRHSEFELKEYSEEPNQTIIELPEDTVVEVLGKQIYPKKKKRTFLDNIETKDIDE